MSDSVSRQAVKNMVDTWTYDMMDPEDVERALHDVDELPSTEPSEEDAVSRRAVIDAVAELVSSMSVCLSIDECHGMKRMQGMAVRAIENLPSAQPEIIRCKDCIYYSNGECDSNEMWQNLYGETTEVEYISRYPNDFCSYAERRNDDER